MQHGLEKTYAAYEVITVLCPDYSPDSEPDTDILNGHKLQHLNLMLANEVENACRHNLNPVVIGGDCALLPGVLAGIRRSKVHIVLLHIDGHSDYRHPGNWTRGSKPGAAAGMDLALVTGRGEALLTE